MGPTSPQKKSVKKTTLYTQLCQMANLEAAWRMVRSNAERSRSKEIRDEVKNFDKSAGSKLKSIQTRLSRSTFVFKPAKPVAIKRKGKKPRPIVVAPIESRIVQRALLNIIQNIPEIRKELTAGFNFGGVPGEGFGVPAAIAKAVVAIRQSGYYVRTDIQAFFVNVPRDTAVNSILQFVPDEDVKELFRNATTTELDDVARLGADIQLFPIYDKGVAQGSALSPLLCNYLLKDFDREMNGRGIVCIRYIDDFILFAKNKKTARIALASALAQLKALGLDAYDPSLPAHAAKAEEGPTTEPIQFLGCELKPNRIRPTNEKVASLLDRIEEIFSECIAELADPTKAILSPEGRHTFSGAIVGANNVIRGWGNTYSFCNDDQLMRNVDIEIDKRLGNFVDEYRKRIRQMKENDRRRAMGLFLLDDCKKDDAVTSARMIAMSPIVSSKS